MRREEEGQRERRRERPEGGTPTARGSTRLLSEGRQSIGERELMHVVATQRAVHISLLPPSPEPDLGTFC